ncbi:phosphotransferase enzyme family protein [Halalkalibacter alkalisediminis]|uniref:Phosphotransferase enzyme family protein n=1 Tax=Halalkalibacter alkalisediminis TaxID=935616 RepID=A0ABV6NNC1_9BACI|nr:phosphotransferase [Halalkalibacter alkalisediminis]
MVESYQVQFAPYHLNDQTVNQAIDDVLKAVKVLSKEPQQYGLIHSDLHTGNFHFDGKVIKVFDFDDCGFQHFMHDIAIPLYYLPWQFPHENDEEEVLAFSKMFLSHFLKGYEKEYSIHSLEHLPLFLKFRDCELYAVLHKS